MNPMILNARHMLQHGSAAVIIRTQAAGEETLKTPQLKCTQCKNVQGNYANTYSNNSINEDYTKIPMEPRKCSTLKSPMIDRPMNRKSASSQ